MFQKKITFFCFCALFLCLSFNNSFGQTSRQSLRGQPMFNKMGPLDAMASKKQATSFGNAASPQNGPIGNAGGGLGAFSNDYQIHILGQVNKSGTFRVQPSTRLDEAINLAEGITDRGSLRNIEIRRDGQIKTYDLFLYRKVGELNQNPFLKDNDVVFVPYAQSNVAIQGPVKTPGAYEITSHEQSIEDLIVLAGGFTTGVTDNDPVTIIRFVDGQRELIQIQNDQQALGSTLIKNGDTVIIPHLLGENRKFDYDIVELPADNVFYPSQRNDVFVTGAVSSPGPYPFNAAYTVRDFINYAGPIEQSDLRGISILTLDGRIVRGNRRLKSFKVSPGDSIIVPKRSLTTDNVLKWYNTVTGTIFSGFALKSLLQ